MPGAIKWSNVQQDGNSDSWLLLEGKAPSPRKNWDAVFSALVLKCLHAKNLGLSP